MTNDGREWEGDHDDESVADQVDRLDERPMATPGDPPPLLFVKGDDDGLRGELWRRVEQNLERKGVIISNPDDTRTVEKVK